MHLQNLLSTAILALSFTPQIVNSQCIKVTGKIRHVGGGIPYAESTFFVEDKTPGRTGCDFREAPRYWLESSKENGFDGPCNGISGNVVISLDGKKTRYFYRNGTWPIRWTNKVYSTFSTNDEGYTITSSIFGGDNGEC